MSSVLYATAEIVPGLAQVARACSLRGIPLLVDAYHHLNAVPFDIDALGLREAFVTGGGYKYCQLGEGNAFLRIPAGCQLRPVLTGWFAEFGDLEEGPGRGVVPYGQGAARFAGATYDLTAHYRAAAVQAFHSQAGLTPELLREVSRHQVSLLRRLLEDTDSDPAVARIEPMPEERRGGFLAIRAPRALDLVRGLRLRGVYADARGDVLRLGPAPYLSDGQLRAAAAAYADLLRTASTLHGPAPRAAM
jgi:kynureninase